MSQPNNRPWQRLLQLTYRIEDSLLVSLLTAMIVLAASQITLRNVFNSGISWSDPLVRALVLWVGLLGAMVGAREDNHIRIDVLSRFLPPLTKEVSASVTALFTAAICGLLAFHGMRLVLMDWEAQTTAFALVPTWLLEAVMPFGFAVMALRYLALAIIRWCTPRGGSQGESRGESAE